MSEGNGNGNGAAKKKIGVYWAASCGGCDISVLEIGPRILDLIAVAEIVLWPCAADFKYADVAGYPDGYIDYCFCNGGIRNSEQEEVARLLRCKSKTIIAYGACACGGGIPALANLKSKAAILDAAYLSSPSTPNLQKVLPQHITPSPVGDLEIPILYDQVLRLSDVIEVDYELPGCPPNADRVWEAILALASGAVPERNNALRVGCGDKSVCDECQREKRNNKVEKFQRPHLVRPEPGWCLMEQGIICMGAATRSGCGALCTDAGLPCEGCYGPAGDVEDQGTAMVSAIGSILAARTEEEADAMVAQIYDPVGTFYRFTLASSHLKGCK
jgi:F420-non-reducing hydrogenase small subunit